MQIEPLDFAHQDVLEDKLRQMNLSLSEYSFANLYLFRQVHCYEVIRLENETFIKGRTRDKIPFIMLTSHPKNISIEIIQQLLCNAEILFPIPENWLGFFEKEILQASFKDEDSDYLYLPSKLATYPGRHLDGKRNQVKQFLAHSEVRSENLVQQIEDAQIILDEWIKNHDENSSQADYLSCQEALRRFHHLHLHGRIVYVDQKPAGFVVGEMISRDCYAIHFSKASRSVKGIYQYLFQDLAQSLEGKCSWINFEQDLGIPSLRYSKLSYHPDHLEKKWRLQIQIK